MIILMLMNFLIMMNFKLIDCKYISIKDLNKKLSPSPVILLIFENHKNNLFLFLAPPSVIKRVCEKYLSSEQY